MGGGGGGGGCLVNICLQSAGFVSVSITPHKETMLFDRFCAVVGFFHSVLENVLNARLQT